MKRSGATLDAPWADFIHDTGHGRAHEPGAQGTDRDDRPGLRRAAAAIPRAARRARIPPPCPAQRTLAARHRPLRAPVLAARRAQLRGIAAA